MSQLVWLMQEYVVLSKIGNPFYLNNFPHMDMVTFYIYFNSVINLKILWNNIITTQHRNISGLEELCVPTNLVHIIYGCFFSLVAIIGGNLFTIQPRNPNHIHKDSNDLLSMIINWWEIFMVAKHFFMMEWIWMTLEKENMFWSIHVEDV